MTDDRNIPIGSDASAGSYRCNDCGEEITTRSVTSLPPCPKSSAKAHSRKSWSAVSGTGDAARDPQS